jgi:hypothetical protein
MSRREVDRYHRAVSDMITVGHVAAMLSQTPAPEAGDEGIPTSFTSSRLIAPGEVGVVREYPARFDADTLTNPILREVVETGLVVTYARPFLTGQGPLPENRFVPPERRDLHRELLARRNKRDAHIDEDAPVELRREVRSTFGLDVDGEVRTPITRRDRIDGGEEPPPCPPGTPETSVRMIERHYGALVDGAHAAIADRLDALETVLDEAGEDEASTGE